MRRPVALVSSVWLLATSAQAAIYDHEIAADDEEDLYALQQRGDISADALATLLELFREGVDLNSASRDALYDLPGLSYSDVDAVLAYRKAKGRIEDPGELVSAGAITAAQLIQIAPFISIEAARGAFPVSGKVRLSSAITATDNLAPPALLIGRFKGPWDLSAGLMFTTTRRWIATPRYSPVTDSLVPASVGPPNALLTDGFGYHLHAPRLFAQWKAGTRRVVVGSYTLGFGERLTLDNTRRVTPHGIYLTDDFVRPSDLSRTCKISGGDPINGGCVDGEQNLYVTSDFGWRDGLRGVAASLEDVSLGGETSLSAYGFLSYQTQSIYQYELFDRAQCTDPRSEEKACKAPTVFLNEGTPSSPRVGVPPTKLIYATLPYLYEELAGGGHFELRPSYRWRLGVTGYGASPMFHANTAPLRLDFQEWSATPGGGTYGAVGLDAQLLWGQFTFSAEATRTFDQAPGGGGGFGVVQRTTWSPKRHEVELSLRYYDTTFANPLARPVSAPDEYDGQRARNELGVRARYVGRPTRDWELKARADLWVLPHPRLRYVSPTEREVAEPAGVANAYALARVDFVGWTVFQPSLWVDVRNRNLASSQHGTCASDTIVYTEGSPFVCSGDLYRFALRTALQPLGRWLTLITQFWFTLSDDRRYPNAFRQDAMVWGEVRSQPFEWLSLRFKTRYLFQDVTDNTYLEQSLWTFLEVAWAPVRGTRLSLRYDVYVWLDQRESTKSRVPNPEHRFFVDLRTSF